MAFHHPKLPIGRTQGRIFFYALRPPPRAFFFALVYSRVTFESEKKFEIANEEAPRALE
ncbi:hypothetical protein PLACP1_10730 [Planifilum fimeticola]